MRVTTDRLALNSKDAEKFDKFHDHVRRIEEHARQYGHLEPRMFWAEHPDEEFKQLFADIRPLLFGLARPMAYPLAEELPPYRLSSTESAHEALCRTLEYPSRLIGRLSVLDGPKYSVLKTMVFQEFQQLFPFRDALPNQTAAKIRIRGTEVDGQFSLRCIRGEHQMGTAYFPTFMQRQLLMILDSPSYKRLTRGWDEEIWDQIWGCKRRDGKPSEKYARIVKSSGGDGGVPNKLVQIVSGLKHGCRDSFGPPRDGEWLERVNRAIVVGRKINFYCLNEHVDWRVLPKETRTENIDLYHDPQDLVRTEMSRGSRRIAKENNE